MSGEANANSPLLLIGVLRWPRLRPSIAVLAACGVLVCSTALAQRVAPGALPSGPAGMPGVAWNLTGQQVAFRYGQPARP